MLLEFLITPLMSLGMAFSTQRQGEQVQSFSLPPTASYEMIRVCRRSLAASNTRLGSYEVQIFGENKFLVAIHLFGFVLRFVNPLKCRLPILRLPGSLCLVISGFLLAAHKPIPDNQTITALENFL